MARLAAPPPINVGADEMQRRLFLFGFTVIELMVVIAVVAILAVMAVPSFVNTLAKKRLRRKCR